LPSRFGAKKRRYAMLKTSPRKIILALPLIMVIGLVQALLYSCAETGENVQKDVRLRGQTTHESTQSEGDTLVIESIELERRNWESHGTDVRIDAKGIFSVDAVYLGKTRRVREGTASRKQMGEIERLIEDSRYYDLQDEFTGPFKTDYAWWGYQLTIKTNRGIKSVRFHSEDETVPEKLRELLEVIMEATK
jgi:hypothetical protein